MRLTLVVGRVETDQVPLVLEVDPADLTLKVRRPGGESPALESGEVPADMTTPEAVLMSGVNLDAYSLSPGFLGFCIPGTVRREVKAERLLSMLSILLESATLASSLTVDSDLDSHFAMYDLSDAARLNIETLLTKGVVGNDEEPDLDSLRYFENIDATTSLEVIELQAVSGGAVGHAFFVDCASGWIVYPHDDGGLGFLASCEEASRRSRFDALIRIFRVFSPEFEFELGKHDETIMVEAIAMDPTGRQRE